MFKSSFFGWAFILFKGETSQSQGNQTFCGEPGIGSVALNKEEVQVAPEMDSSSRRYPLVLPDLDPRTLSATARTILGESGTEASASMRSAYPKSNEAQKREIAMISNRVKDTFGSS